MIYYKNWSFNALNSEFLSPPYVGGKHVITEWENVSTGSEKRSDANTNYVQHNCALYR